MFKENFERLCNAIGKSPTAVCVEIGLAHSVYSLWTEKTVPRRATLIKIADYFGVTPESLVAENEQKKDPAQMSREEKKSFIMQKYFQMTEENQKTFEQFVDYLLETQEKTPPDDSANR